MNLKIENMLLKEEGFEIEEVINPVGATDYLVYNAKGSFLRRCFTLAEALLYCYKKLFSKARKDRG